MKVQGTPIFGAEIKPPRSVFVWLLDSFSNVWLGVILATLFFVYCSVGSAKPDIPQHPLLEMTEFEWFHWWPFNVLVVLFCLNLSIATVRRIPLRLENLGVWSIHTGIIVLCLGSYYYFGTKVEGDTPVFRRRVTIRLPGDAGSAILPALPGSRARIPVGKREWRFAIQSTNHSWPILSDPHKGEKAYAVNVLVSPPGGESFVRQLLAGYPQYTEDVIPGKGRAIKSIGRKLVEEDLDITLDYEPQEFFHVMDTWALYVRPEGAREWVQRPIKGLPRFNDYVGSRDQVFMEPHEHLPLRALDLVVAASADGDALASAGVRITGYLRYAHMERRWLEGGVRLNPVLKGTLIPSEATPQSFELMALDRTRSRSADGLIELRWFDDSSDIEKLPLDAHAVLGVSVPGKNVTFEVKLTAENIVGDTGSFSPIPDTDFSYRVRNVQDGLSIPGSSRLVSLVMVDIKTPEGRFTRMVADQPGMTRDLSSDSDPHSSAPSEADARISMTYQPRSAPIIFVAHPRGLHLVVNGPTGRVVDRKIDLGEVVEVVAGLRVRADTLFRNAVSSVKPYVVPRSARRPNVNVALAMIRLEVDTGHETQTHWLSFNQYALANESYAYGGRLGYHPVHLHLPNGSGVEVLFSRERRALPNPIALESFSLDTHIGGFGGQANTIRNYVSELRFQQAGRWTDATPIQVNAPTGFGGLWYFQSTWDKPAPNDPTSGMNYTGLGVGNRNGVYIQLVGCCISVAGMIFAFYIKPMVIRRRRGDHSYSGLQSNHSDPPTSIPAQEMAVEV